jgi:hypothetical protein
VFFLETVGQWNSGKESNYRSTLLQEWEPGLLHTVATAGTVHYLLTSVMSGHIAAVALVTIVAFFIVFY